MAHGESPQNMAPRDGSLDPVDRRKARKRELDRISQQRKRKNDRETISKLKAQVKALEQQSDDNHVYNMILKQEKDQERIKRHLERVKHIEALVEADLKDLGEDDSQTPPADTRACNSVMEAQHLNDTHQQVLATTQIDRPSFDPDATFIPNPQVVDLPRSHLDAMTWDDLTDGIHTVSPDGESNKQSPEEYMDLEDISSFEQGLANGTPVDIPELPSLSLPLNGHHEPDWALQGSSILEDSQISRGDDCHRCDSMWTVCNTAIVQSRGPFLSSSSAHGFEDGDAHVIITAITEGWAKAAKSPYWNGHWDSLRQIDQFCHPMCEPVERMSSLYTLIRLFKYQRFPGDPLAVELPTFLRARPSQLHVPHASVVDHFIWPGFREHLVFDHRKYHNNTFSNDYGVSLRFLWPFELRDTYLKNRQTGLYQFSSDFVERADDLRCYTMKSQFLAKYPEFQGDVPVFDPAPRMMSQSGGGKAIFCHFPVSKGSLEERRVEEVEETRRIMA